MKKEEVIVFIGDSITDAGRLMDPEGIGESYVRLIRDYLAINYSEQYPMIINKGISGNRIIDLQARWEEDVLALNPTILSISIGINDVWRQLDHPEMSQVSPNLFKEIYEKLLEKTKKQTSAQLVLMEPTVIQEKVHSRGNILLKEYVNSIHQLAEKYDAIVVPTHQIFIHYLQEENHLPLTVDGVHMTSTGNLLMAQAWLKEVLK